MAVDELRVAFYDPDTMLARPLLGGNTYLLATEATGKSFTSKIGNGSVTIAFTELSKVGDAEYLFIYQHDICIVWRVNGAVSEKVSTFVIRSVKMKPAKTYGMASFFVLSGPDIMYYLGKMNNYTNIGQEYSTVQTLGDTSNFLFVEHKGPTDDLQTEGFTNVLWNKWTLKKRSSRNAGATSVGFYTAVESAKAGSQQWKVGDDINIVWNFSPEEEHRTSIISITPDIDDPSENDYNLAEALPHSVPKQEGSGQNRYYPCYKPFLKKGDPIEVQMDGGTWHKTRISEDAHYDGIKMEEAAPLNISAGATLKWINGREPNTIDDVDAIMAPATDWTVNGSVSSRGSAHIIDSAAKTFELLEKTAASAGDYFYTSQATASVPQKVLEWKNSSPSTLMTLMVPSQATMQADVASATNIIINSLTRESRHLPITRIVPVGGNSEDVGAEWNLGIVDETPAAGLLRLYGIDGTEMPDALITEYVDGVWRIRNASGVQNIEERMEFNDIIPTSSSAQSLVEAANALQAVGALQLYLYRRTEHYYLADIVLPEGSNINPGESMILDFTESEWSTENVVVYISEMEHAVKPTGPLRGLRHTKLVLTQYQPYGRMTGATAVANAIRTGLSGGGSSSVRGVGGIGSVPPSVGNPPTIPQELVTVASSTPTGALTIDSQALTFVLTLNTDSGLQFTGTELKMGTPTYVGSVTADGVSGTGHTHSVLSTDDADNNHYQLLRSDADGRLRLAGLGINAASDGDHINIADNSDMFGDNYQAAGASGFTGQFYLDTENTDGEGTLFISNIVADSLIVQLFQAEMTIATSSGLLVTKSVGIISDTFGLVSVGNSVSITIEDNPIVGTAGVFEENDKVVFRAYKRDSGFSLFWVGGYVDGYSDNGDGTQDWTLHIEDLGGGSHTDVDILKGTPIMDYGVSGQGWWEVDASRDVGPMTRTGTWAGADPWTVANRSIHTQTGRLLDLTGVDQHGFYAGVSPQGPHVLISDTTAEFQDVGITMSEGTPDGGYIRIHAIELNSDIETAVAPDGNTYNPGVSKNLGTDYYEHIDNNPASGQPDADYVYNTDETNGQLNLTMEDLTHTLATLEVEAYVVVGGFVDDTCQLHAQMVRNYSPFTELTDEIKVASEATSSGLVTIPFTGIDSTGTDSDWGDALLVLKWKTFVAGSDEILTIDTTDGIQVVADTGFAAKRAYTFLDTSGEFLGGMYAYHDAVFPATAIQILSQSPTTGDDSLLNIWAYGPIDGDAQTAIRAQGDNGDGQEVLILLESDAVSGADITVTGADSFNIEDSVLILDQGTLDGTIISARSSDFDDGVAQGMVDEEYFYVKKASDGNAGAALRGGGDANHAIWLIGSCQTADATEATSSLAPVMLRGMIDDGIVGSGNNAVAMQSGTSTIWLIKNDGTMHMANAHSTTYFDDYDDISLVRAMADTSGKGFIRSKWDDFVTHNKQDLINLEILSDDGDFVSTQGIIQLQNGALWQLHQRIAELEDKIRGYIH